MTESPPKNSIGLTFWFGIIFLAFGLWAQLKGLNSTPENATKIMGVALVSMFLGAVCCIFQSISLRGR